MREILSASLRPKLALAALVASAIFAGAYGFAASFGMPTSGLGAGDNVIASCGSGLTFAYTTTFVTGLAGYAVNGIDLTNIPSRCLGKSLSVTFYDSSDTLNGSAINAAVPASGTSERVPIAPSANTIDAGQISGVSVVIS